MIHTQAKKRELFARRRLRGKKKLDRFSGKPRLVVTRSARHISAQVVDDMAGNTLVSASSMEKALQDDLKAAGNKTAVANRIGQELARRAAKKKIGQVVFDRNGRVYHGRIKALAEGAREGGLQF